MCFDQIVNTSVQHFEQILFTKQTRIWRAVKTFYQNLIIIFLIFQQKILKEYINLVLINVLRNELSLLFNLITISIIGS